MRLGILTSMLPCVAAALTLAACDVAATDASGLPAGLKLPVFEAVESDADDENLSVAVTATDAAGLGAGQPGFAGASRDGQCRVYFDNVTPVTSAELYDQAFNHLDAVVQAAGGPEVLMRDPERIPVVHIWGDVNAPWRCIAGAIYNVQAAGYPTVGFVSTPVESDGAPGVTHAAYIDLPVPDPSEGEGRLTNKIVLTARNEIMWNGAPVDEKLLVANLQAAGTFGVVPELEFEPEADVSYDFAAKVLSIISAAHVPALIFAGSDQHRSFEKAE